MGTKALSILRGVSKANLRPEGQVCEAVVGKWELFLYSSYYVYSFNEYLSCYYFPVLGTPNTYLI